MYLDCHSIYPSECHLLDLGSAKQHISGELYSIFSHFGTVDHYVILATVDNASRRRGFVVMSNHAEAKAAMDNISQTNIRYVAAKATYLHPLLDHVLRRGSIVDVSWAVVQRSQGALYLLGAYWRTDGLYLGFLDGGDRTVTLEGQIDPAPPSTDLSPTPAFQASAALGDHSEVSPLSGARAHHACILVRNIPALLFAQDSDLEPLFCPFGDVKDIQRQGVSSSTRFHADTFSVIVTYSSAAGAREAKAGLEGQRYGDTPLIVKHLSPFRVGGDTETGLNYGCDHASRSSLNPCASPFVFDHSSAASAPPTCPISGTFLDYVSQPSSSRFVTPYNRSSPSEPVLQGYRSLPTSGHSSRTNSAASWTVSPARPTSRM
jgi:RNA recognition motif-containing protein